MKKTILIVSLCVIVLSACQSTAPVPTSTPIPPTETPNPTPTVTPTEAICPPDEMRSAGLEFVDLYNQWLDEFDLASSTPRISLNEEINNLQEIKREVTKLEVPICMEKLKSLLVQTMEETIDGFLSYLAQESDSAAADKFNQATQTLKLFNKEMERITACLPNCKPE